MKTSVVAAHIGVSPRTLRRYVHQDLLQPWVRARGDQDRHTWHERDIPVARLVRMLITDGCPKEQIRTASKVVSSEQDWDGLWLLIDALDVQCHGSVERLADAIHFAGRAVRVVELGHLAKEVG